MEKKVSEKEMRATYVKVFGKEFDDPSRKQHPLPLELAYKVALNSLSKKQYAKGGVTKNYVPRAELNTVTINRNGKKLTYKISDVLNGAYALKNGGNIKNIAFYVAKRNVVRVQGKTGKQIKPANGYWIKKDAKPIHKMEFGGDFQSGVYAGGGLITETADAIFFPNAKNGKIKTSFGDKTKEGLLNMLTNVNYDRKEIVDAIFDSNEKNGKINTGFGAKTKEGLSEMIKNMQNTFENGGGVDDNEVKFITYKDEEIMYEPTYSEYFVNDEQFSTLKEAKNYIDKGSPMSQQTINAYRKGAFAYGGGLNRSLISGTSGRSIVNLPHSKYKIIKEVTNAQANGKNNITYTNIVLPKGSIVNNLRGGVFVKNEKLKEKYSTIYNEKYGLPITRKEETLNEIYKNSEILEYAKGGDLGIEEEIDLTDDNRLRVKELTYEYKKPTAKELAEKHNSGAYEFMEQDKFEGGGKTNDVWEKYQVQDKFGYVSYFDDKAMANKFLKENEGSSIVRWDDDKMMSGGKTTFNEKSNAIAKRFEGKRVEPKYQKEYGKVYSKDEAKEVGNKITGSMVSKEKMMSGGNINKGYFKNEIDNDYIEEINKYYNKWNSIKDEKDSENFKNTKPPMFGTYKSDTVIQQINHFEKIGIPFQANEVLRNQFKKEISKIIEKFLNQKMMAGGKTKQGNKGEAMQLAKQIRKDGEKWTDAVKRAWSQLK